MERRRDHRSKGERTRQRIVEEAAVLFNMRGFAGASMADVSEATGLEKGGVYNHFATKDELALAAFDYAAGLVRERIEAAFASGVGCVGRLRAFLDAYRKTHERPFIKGGCPLMNTAIEADDTNPVLRLRAREAIEFWRTTIADTLVDGMRTREIRAVEPAAVASVMIATVEGGVMLAKLYGSMSHLTDVLDHLEAYVSSLRVERAPSRE